MNDPKTAVRPPLFSRAALLVISFLSCLAALTGLWLTNDRVWAPTQPLPIVLLTLLIVLPVGEFIRNRFRLSLMAMLVLLTAMAVLLAVGGSHWKRARQLRKAVASLRALESVELPESLRLNPDLSGVQPSVGVDYVRDRALGKDYVRVAGGWIMPTWLVNALGEDMFFKVHDVSVSWASLRSADIAEGIEFGSIDHLYFGNCQFGSEALRRLAEHKQLRHLNMVNCELTDKDLALLASLTDLESLRLNNHQTFGMLNQFSADGVRSIATMKSLQSLTLGNAGLKPGDLDSLEALQGIQYLDVSNNSQVNNSDAQLIRKLPNLRGINFSGTAVNEEVIPMLKGLPKLEWATISASTPEIEKKLVEQEDSRAERPMIYFR